MGTRELKSRRRNPYKGGVTDGPMCAHPQPPDPPSPSRGTQPVPPVARLLSFGLVS